MSLQALKRRCGRDSSRTQSTGQAQSFGGCTTPRAARQGPAEVLSGSSSWTSGAVFLATRVPASRARRQDQQGASKPRAAYDKSMDQFRRHGHLFWRIRACVAAAWAAVYSGRQAISSLASSAKESRMGSATITLRYLTGSRGRKGFRVTRTTRSGHDRAGGAHGWSPVLWVR